MKHLVFFIMLTLLFTTTMQAQKLTTDTLQTPKSYAYYRQKRNTYNTIGWVCLGTGSLLVFTGLVVNIGETFDHGSNSKGEATAVVGEVLVFASIPLFIIAHHNKKKASLYLSKGSVTIKDRPLYKTNYTGLSLAIKF